jgi:3-oxoacyl-[acyl-carrier-protein] synthase-3
MTAIRTGIVATGSYLPETVVTNESLTQFPAQSLPLIEQKTGVKARRFADKDACTSDLAIKAAERCLGNAGFDPRSLDGIIVATSSPDRMQPATATRVQSEIGATNAFAYDINSVCSGAVFGLTIADAYVKAGFCKNVLLVAAEMYSKILNPADFSTYPYFGDGAGAVLLSPSRDGRGIVDAVLRSDGAGADVIQVPAGGTKLPFDRVENKKDIYFKMKGKEVFDFAVTRGTEVIEELLRKTNTETSGVKYVVAHQANVNVLKEISRRVGMAEEAFPITLDRYGNTAAASVLIGLDELVAAGAIAAGDKVVLVAFGGGLSWGAALIQF